MSYRNLSDAHVIVNVDKGYTLRRIGTFTSSLENHIVHTFISIDDSAWLRQVQTFACTLRDQRNRLYLILSPFD